jgi:hypothetical protein
MPMILPARGTEGQDPIAYVGKPVVARAGPVATLLESPSAGPITPMQ